MSDAYYRERAARRARIFWIAAGLVALVVLTVLGVRALFYDACTRSFERSPRAIVETFVQAVGNGQAFVAQECWEHQAYYDLAAGCSQICLDRFYGTGYRVLEVVLETPQITSQGRANLTASVSIVCEQGGQTHTGELWLDSVGADLPWKHWAIVRSTFGGSVAQPWCK
ncbi:MAG: hypothetical protein ACOYZ7_09695 [Chloroflexota bacterium]